MPCHLGKSYAGGWNSGAAPTRPRIYLDERFDHVGSEGGFKMNRTNTILCVLFLLCGCGGSSTPIIGCDAGEGLTPDCRFQNPEDLAVVPSGDGLLVSQFGAMDGSKAGNIAFYAPRDGRIEVLFPRSGMADDRSWGDPECPPPDADAFAPHGIDLQRRADGRHMLLAVNHGLRESIEFLELTEGGGGVQLTWRGCALGPDHAHFNDVVGRPDGGFWVTHMMARESPVLGLLAGALFGADTGHVYSWDRVDGFEKVPGSDGPFPNGIEKSDDERYLFINMYMAGEVRKLSVDEGRVVATAEISRPDNITWGTGGRLLVASHTGGILELVRCEHLEEGSCGLAFEIVALDPERMTTSVLLSNRGAPMGAATVAVVYDGALYLGTFAGDRITRADLPEHE